MRIGDVDFVWFTGDVACIFDNVDKIGLVDDWENRFFDGVFNGLELSLDSFLQVLWFLTERVKHEYIVFSLESSLLFEPLNFVDNLSWESLDLQFFVLSAVKQDDNFVASDGLMF